MSLPNATADKFPCWLICSDLATAAVGPFFSQREIDEHIQFMSARGDAAVIFHANLLKVVSNLSDARYDFTITPADDRKELL